MGQHVADRFVVLLDANVLYPIWMRDVLLRFCEAGLFRARWSEQIIDEWSRSLLRRQPHLADNVEAQKTLMREHFEDAWVTGHEALIPALTLPDPDDRHVLAAAIVAGAQHIITQNLKHFPAAALEPFDIEAIEADEFLYRTFELYNPEPAVSVFRTMREAYVAQPFGQAEFIMALIKNGMPRLASALRPYQSYI